MKRLFKILLGCFLLTRFLSAEVLFKSGFDNRYWGEYTRAMLFEDWSPKWENGLDEGRVSIVGLGEAFWGNGIRVEYPKGAVGSDAGGAQWIQNVPGYEEMYASYHVMFPGGWDGVLGGKLPGLCGAECPCRRTKCHRFQRVQRSLYVQKRNEAGNISLSYGQN